MKYYEMNFDGLVGPTHNYSGLSPGNIASKKNALERSNPKEAAMQGLAKMKFMHDMGIKQGILLPHERPNIHVLRRIGFSGSDAEVIRKASKLAPEIYYSCCSASAMWTANAATVSPSADTNDGKVHITPANLLSNFHRSLEPPVTGRMLKAIFNNDRYFFHHELLPSCGKFSDEGAANHTRFCETFGDPGIEFFVYGRHDLNSKKNTPKKFPARQTFEASEAISRLHGLNTDRTIFAQQNPDVIDEGVFHNDVAAVGNQHVFFFHERAFLNKKKVYEEIKKKADAYTICFIEVSEKQVSMKDAVKSYLFNSQLVTLKDNDMMLIIPEECKKIKSTWCFLQTLMEWETLVKSIKSFDLRQSMQNGGGPACLRLRVVLNSDELKSVNQKIVMNKSLFKELFRWIEKHFRDCLTYDDLKDPKLLVESRTALDELTRITGMGSVYSFQMA